MKHNQIQIYKTHEGRHFYIITFKDGSTYSSESHNNFYENHNLAVSGGMSKLNQLIREELNSGR